MKKKVLIISIALICLSNMLWMPFVISLFKSEDDRIIDTINTGNTDFLNNVSSLIFKTEVEDGIFCLAVSENGLFIVSYLENERFSDTQYNLLGRVITEIDNIISDNPLSVKKMSIANFSKYSYYFGFCTSEKAKKLSIDGNIIETKKINAKIDNKVYSGYFWFYKSIDEPNVQICVD